MAKLSAHKESKPFKGMIIGDSGSGKTGSLASLAAAGYKLVIMDFDSGLDILAQVIPEQQLDTVEYVTFNDEYKAVGGKVIPKGQAKAWANGLKFLESGTQPDGTKFIPADKLTREHVLVVDSLTMASSAAMLQVLQVNQRLLETPHQSDWGEGQRIIRGLVEWLTSDQIKCHVIVNSHISYIELQEGLTKGYPSSLGKALSPQLPRYFNTILLCKSVGIGKNSKRIITALPQGIVETKALVPHDKLPESWSIQTGLAEFFKLAGFKPEAEAVDTTVPSAVEKATTPAPLVFRK